MRTLCFVVPAHGRLEIAQVCFRQLRRTCDALLERDILADAVVIADDENLELAQACGFATVERENTGLGAKINDGYQLAAEHGAEFFVPCGSDDWVHQDWIALPRNDVTVVTHWSTVVNEDCTKLAKLSIRFGDGVRVYTRQTLQKVGFRPAPEDRQRAMDAATDNATAGGATKHFHDTNPLHIVDFKSSANLNDYHGCQIHYGRQNESDDVWGQLAALYPAEAISEMQAVHGLVTA